MITKEQIEQRKSELLADYHAISGAVQDCDHWLDVLAGEEESSDSPPIPALPEDLPEE